MRRPDIFKAKVNSTFHSLFRIYVNIVYFTWIFMYSEKVILAAALNIDLEIKKTILYPIPYSSTWWMNLPKWGLFLFYIAIITFPFYKSWIIIILVKIWFSQGDGVNEIGERWKRKRERFSLDTEKLKQLEEGQDSEIKR